MTTIRESRFLQLDLTLNLLLIPIITYWHDHMQAPDPQTPSILGLTTAQAPMLVTLRSHSKVSDHLHLLIFVVAIRFYHCLTVDLVLVDSCVVRRYNTSQISQGVTHKSSKGLQNVARVSLLYVDKLDWNPIRFRRLGPYFKVLHNLISMIFDQSNLIFDRSGLADSQLSFLQLAQTWSLKHTSLSNA